MRITDLSLGSSSMKKYLNKDTAIIAALLLVMMAWGPF